MKFEYTNNTKENNKYEICKYKQYTNIIGPQINECVNRCFANALATSLGDLLTRQIDSWDNESRDLILMKYK